MISYLNFDTLLESPPAWYADYTRVGIIVTTEIQVCRNIHSVCFLIL